MPMDLMQPTGLNNNDTLGATITGTGLGGGDAVSTATATADRLMRYAFS